MELLSGTIVADANRFERVFIAANGETSGAECE
jgi:hypothetical protein